MPRTKVVETHVSRLFFVDDRVFKAKKPVVTGFLDFSAEAARRRACEREVELNRRLAPDVYLGVATVLAPDGGACEHLVVMRRLPDEARLSARVASGVDVTADLERIAAVVARFHAQAVTSEVIAAQGTPEAVLGRWRANTKEMRTIPGSWLDLAALERIDALATGYVKGRSALFAARIAGGRVRDGHGDLLADDIFCLPDGPRIIDCLEFDDRLRYGDTLEDVAFLAMDLEHLGAPERARQFLDAWQKAARDSAPRSLLDFYIAYRAQVRAKVAALRAQEGLGGSDDAGALPAMAEDHLTAAQVRLVLVGGPPGVGKSTLSEALGHRLGWPVVRSDALRGQVAGPARPSGYGQGRYATEAVDAVYRALMARARRHLEVGESVILDASWRRQAHRGAAAALASETASILVEMRCAAPAAQAAERLARRAREGRDPSEATPEIAARLAVDTDPWPSATTIDSSGALEDAVESALAAAGQG